MSGTSQIEWTERTWNPTTGCSKVSAGCKNCYAESMAIRLKFMKARGYENGFALSLMPDRLQEPLRRKKATTYFVNSMSDLFHPKIPFAYLNKVFSVMERTPQHCYQILTKRPRRMLAYAKKRNVPDNVWLGVTVENIRHGLERIDLLRQVHAKTRFLSIEPLLENLGKIDFTHIHWVIVGGESGAQARPMKKGWVINIQEQCEEQDVAFFFKQWGTWGEDNQKRSKKANGGKIDGKFWRAYPPSAL